MLLPAIRVYMFYLSRKIYTIPLSDKGKATEWGRQVAEDIAYRERTDIGATAEDFFRGSVGGKKGQPV